MMGLSSPRIYSRTMTCRALAIHSRQADIGPGQVIPTIACRFWDLLARLRQVPGQRWPRALRR